MEHVNCIRMIYNIVKLNTDVRITGMLPPCVLDGPVL